MLNATARHCHDASCTVTWWEGNMHNNYDMSCDPKSCLYCLTRTNSVWIYMYMLYQIHSTPLLLLSLSSPSPSPLPLPFSPSPSPSSCISYLWHRPGWFHQQWGAVPGAQDDGREQPDRETAAGDCRQDYSLRWQRWRWEDIISRVLWCETAYSIHRKCMLLVYIYTMMNVPVSNFLPVITRKGNSVYTGPLPFTKHTVAIITLCAFMLV